MLYNFSFERTSSLFNIVDSFIKYSIHLSEHREIAARSFN